ncbi:30S ribosome-binding factor RbfA [soil metagenome]
MKHRLLRVNELVKRELSRIVTRDLDFDGLLVTINQVNVTPDLRSGHVFVSVLGKGSPAGVIQKLEANRTILQAEMAKTVVLKYTPHLVFRLDDSIERGTRVFKILEEITPASEDDKDEGDETEENTSP